MKSITKSPTEFQEQETFVSWFRASYPGVLIFAIPNGIRTSIRSAVKAKREGVVSGVPDLYIPKYFLFIEMKRRTKCVVSREQKLILNYLNENGQTAVVAKGCDEAISLVKAHIAEFHQGT